MTKPRKREFIWMGCVVALYLLMANLEAGDVSPKVIAEAKEKAEEKKAQVFHALAKCMSEPSTIRVGDEPVATCKPVRKQ